MSSMKPGWRPLEGTVWSHLSSDAGCRKVEKSCEWTKSFDQRERLLADGREGLMAEGKEKLTENGRQGLMEDGGINSENVSERWR